MTLYKVLNEDGTSPVVGYRWPLPSATKPGKWVKASGPLELCGNGVHLCDGERQLLDHLGPVIYEAEAQGERIDGDDKVAVREARLVRRIPQWNERTARLFAALCAERALPIFEAQSPGDDRPRLAIEVARRFADGNATDDELASARESAWASARASARESAWASARASARESAWASARAWQADRLRELLNAPGDWR